MTSTRPDRDALRRWLCSGQVVDPGGRVSSWHNERHAGFPYAEAAALWLSWSAWRREIGGPAPGGEVEGRVAGQLAAELKADGAIGRGGVAYLFDTCVALDALTRMGGGASPVVWRATRAGLRRFLDRDTPVLPAAGQGARWSEAWGPHLHRAAALLLRAATAADREDLAGLAREIRARAGLDPGPRRYLHAVAYAVEGELLARELGEPPLEELDPRAELATLADLQRPDGGLPAWTDGSGGGRTDATAQAVRLWAAVAPDAFAGPCGRALAFLAGCQSPEGGLVYEAGGGDRNTWSTLFADQALAWVDGRADLRGLI